MSELDVMPEISENAKRVLERRYLSKDRNGRVIETPEEMFMRVAANIAKADANYDKRADLGKTEDEFYSVMSRLEFLPNSPTLMNAGKELQQLSACFTKKQKILSNPGYKNIDEIKAGDKVVTAKGKVRKAVEVHRRRYKGPLYTVNIRGLMKPTLEVTEEHPVLAVKKEEVICKRIKHSKCNGVIKKHCLRTPQEYENNCESIGQIIRPEWTPIKDLEKGDFVLVNTNKESKDIKEIKIEDYLADEIYSNKGEYLVARGRPNEGKRIPNKIKIDGDFLKLAGYWLADGSLSKRCDKYGIVRFTFNLKEESFSKEVQKIMKEKFNLTAKKEYTDTQKTIQLRFNSTIAGELFYKLFGSGFNEKRLPEWMITLPQEKQFNLLVGLFRGDGCYAKGKRQDTIFISLSNEKLASDIWNILLRLGYNFNINYRKPAGGTKKAFRISAAPSECGDLVKAVRKGEYRKRKKFPQYINTGGMILRPVDKIETRAYDGEVYNLEVEKDHSYLANGVAVHNCFVLPIRDSMEGIFDSLKSAAMIHKSGGGTGFSFSNLRSKNSMVKTTGGVASGPVSFMKVFDAATQAVKQGGTRRGANMGILRVDHPDIMEFIACKENNKDITNFNISVMITDDFMDKVEKGAMYPLIDPHTNKKTGELDAKEVFELIVKMAWKNGEPGIIFYDKLNKDNPTPAVGSIESTNPCGEQPLLAYESCNLGSINLSRMVSGGKIDWEKMAKTVKAAVHFLDNVIDMNKFPLSIIREKTLENRKIGLGVMGFADMLIKLGIPYDSDEALKTGEEVMRFILEESRRASEELSEKRGPFPNFKKSVFYDRKEKPLRNATLTTIAPTGTLSIIANCSSGIEPIFAVSYIRNVMDNDELVEVHPAFLEIARERGFYSEALMKKIAQKGNVQDMEEIPADVKRLFRTSLDIDPEAHIRMQSAFQLYTNNAVSKTVNFPNNATIDDVRKAYMLAYHSGCKGLTIYRDKSREEQVLNIGKTGKDAPAAEEAKPVNLKPKPRGTVTFGTTTKVSTGCGNLYVTINNDEMGKPFEVFMQMGKAGGCAMSQLEAIGRLVSLALRSGVNSGSIIDQLKGIRCPSPSWEKGGGRIFSCSDAIARVVERRMSEKNEMEAELEEEIKYLDSSLEAKEASGGSVATKSKTKTGSVVGVCPDCGGALRHIEGCQVCGACGFSKCG